MHFPKKNTVIFTFALAAMTEQVTFTSVNMFFTHRRQIERVACNTKVIFTKSSFVLTVHHKLSCLFYFQYDLDNKTDKEVHVITSDGQPGVVPWSNLAGENTSERDIVSRFPPGTCLKAKLVAFLKNGLPKFKVIRYGNGIFCYNNNVIFCYINV